MSASYIENPANCYFEGQDADEDIILLLRAHPITNITWVIPAAVLSLLPFFLPQATGLIDLSLFNVPPSIISAFLIINYLIVLVIVFEGFLYWYFNVSIITNKRVMDVDFFSILLKQINLAPLGSIQEASATTGGILGLLFHFGNVFVQTSGAKISISLNNIPNPDQVADLILDEAYKLQKNKNGS